MTTNSAEQTFLIAGLGNPGQIYSRNRHNIGFRALDAFAAHHNIPLDKARAKATVGIGKIGPRKVMLVKPQSYMNLSGQSIAEILFYYKIDRLNMLVIYDDLDLPFGSIRIRERGSAGGHNGLKDIIARLSSQDFPRLRLGIGRPQRGDIKDYVLNNFPKDEEAALPDLLIDAVRAVDMILAEGIVKAMNSFNSTGSSPTKP